MNHDPGGGYSLKPTPESHPHLRLDECIVSVPKVNPGDTAFWHCDVIHAVEKEHTGSGDSVGKHYHLWTPCSMPTMLGADAWEIK